MSVVNIDGFDTFYKDEGSGTTVLLLHGWGGNNESFAPVFNSLKKCFRVVALDFWGFGKSDLPADGADTYWYAAMTKKFLDALGIQSVWLIGHSFGGRVSLILADGYPDIVQKIVLCDAAGMKPKFSLKKKLRVLRYKICKRLVKLGLMKSNRLSKFGSSDFKQLDGVMQKTFVKVVNDFLEKEAKNTKAETLLVWGSEDKDTPLYMAKKLNRLIENSGLVLINGAGHFSYLDDFLLFDRVVKNFFGVV